MDHIASLKECVSDYTLKKSKVLYLPQDLNLQKMHRMYMELYPNDQCSLESYRYYDGYECSFLFIHCLIVNKAKMVN